MKELRRRMRARSVRALVIGGTAAVLLAACSDFIVDGRTLSIDATGTVQGFVFLDMDGTGGPGDGDEPVGGVKMRLIAGGGGGDVRDAETDSEGFFVFRDAPVGEFRVLPDPESVPDSVEVFDLDEGLFVLARGDTVQRTLRLSFPTYSIEEVRELPPGQRVFTHGIALNSRVSSGDGVVHLKDGDYYLRATAVDRDPGVTARDSVRFLGRTATDAGHPILEDVRPAVLIAGAAVVQPIDVSTEEAASADGGRLDAALVRIHDAVIRDTIQVGGHLAVVADDESGPVDLLLRDFLEVSPAFRSSLVPDSARIDVGVGLLVPIEEGDGSVRWRLLPRAQSDLQVSEIEFEDGEEE